LRVTRLAVDRIVRDRGIPFARPGDLARPVERGDEAAVSFRRTRCIAPSTSHTIVPSRVAAVERIAVSPMIVGHQSKVPSVWT
jgi:hypothetical protein